MYLPTYNDPVDNIWAGRNFHIEKIHDSSYSVHRQSQLEMYYKYNDDHFPAPLHTFNSLEEAKKFVFNIAKKENIEVFYHFRKELNEPLTYEQLRVKKTMKTQPTTKKVKRTVTKIEDDPIEEIKIHFIDSIRIGSNSNTRIDIEVSEEDDVHYVNIEIYPAVDGDFSMKFTMNYPSSEDIKKFANLLTKTAQCISKNKLDTN